MACCADCAKMDLNEQNSAGEFWCGEYRKYYPGSDSSCSNFVERGYNSSGRWCYLTTIVVQVLGYDDNNVYLELLRDFRDSIMRLNPVYDPILEEYDSVGPVIAGNIAKDPDQKALSEKLLNQYIIPVCSLIQEGKYDDAVNLYKTMVLILKKHYSIS